MAKRSAGGGDSGLQRKDGENSKRRDEKGKAMGRKALSHKTSFQGTISTVPQGRTMRVAISTPPAGRSKHPDMDELWNASVDLERYMPPPLARSPSFK